MFLDRANKIDFVSLAMVALSAFYVCAAAREKMRENGQENSLCSRGSPFLEVKLSFRLLCMSLGVRDVIPYT